MSVSLVPALPSPESVTSLSTNRSTYTECGLCCGDPRGDEVRRPLRCTNVNISFSPLLALPSDEDKDSLSSLISSLSLAIVSFFSWLSFWSTGNKWRILLGTNAITSLLTDLHIHEYYKTQDYSIIGTHTYQYVFKWFSKVCDAFDILQRDIRITQ